MAPWLPLFRGALATSMGQLTEPVTARRTCIFEAHVVEHEVLVGVLT